MSDRGESEAAIAWAIADHRRSLGALADVIALAWGTIAAIEGDVEPIDVVRAFERELVGVALMIDAATVDLVVSCLVGFMAGKTGTTPKWILDHHWKASPSDEQWRSIIEDAMRKEAEGEHDDGA